MELSEENFLTCINPQCAIIYNNNLYVDGGLTNNFPIEYFNEDIDNIVWENDTSPIPKADIEAKLVEIQATEDARVAQLATDKASAKVKLKAAEYTPLTEAEADAITI